MFIRFGKHRYIEKRKKSILSLPKHIHHCTVVNCLLDYILKSEIVTYIMHVLFPLSFDSALHRKPFP